MIKALFFDSDGVLVSTERLVFEANQKVFASLDIPYCFDDFADHTLHTNKGSAGFLTERGYDQAFYKTFKHLRQTIWEQKLAAKNHAIPGVKKVLQTLQTDFTLAVTTSAQKKYFELAHQQSALVSYFDFILTQEDYEQIKPAPDVYLKALECAAVTPAQALVIEDTPRGVQAAKAAGLSVVAIPHDFTIGMDFSIADYKLETITELPGLIQTLNTSAT